MKVLKKLKPKLEGSAGERTKLRKQRLNEIAKNEKKKKTLNCLENFSSI